MSKRKRRKRRVKRTRVKFAGIPAKAKEVVDPKKGERLTPAEFMATFEACAKGIREAINGVTHTPANCILSARVAVGICEAFGVPVFPLVARVSAYTPQVARHMEEVGPTVWNGYTTEDVLTLLQKIRDEHGEEPKVVHIGHGNPQEGIEPGDKNGPTWAGHLVAVAIIDGRLRLIDLSIDQANQSSPTFGFTPLFYDLTPDTLKTGFVIENEVGAVVTYELFPGERSFVEEDGRGDWSDGDPDALVAALIEAGSKFVRYQFEEGRRILRRQKGRARYAEEARRLAEGGTS